jgi:hypothetical protein
MFILATVLAALTVGLPPFHSGRILLLIISWLALTLLINIKPMYQYFMRADGTLARGENTADSPKLSGMNGIASLPDFQSIPTDLYTAPAAITADIKTPPSVTEETTNLLHTSR